MKALINKFKIRTVWLPFLGPFLLTTSLFYWLVTPIGWQALAFFTVVCLGGWILFFQRVTYNPIIEEEKYFRQRTVFQGAVINLGLVTGAAVGLLLHLLPW